MNVLLEPAHKLLSANPPTLGGSVGLTAAPPQGAFSAPKPVPDTSSNSTTRARLS